MFSGAQYNAKQCTAVSGACLGEGGGGGGVSTAKALACHCRNELNPNTYLHVFFVKVFVFVLDFPLLNIQLLLSILEGFLPV